jgi:hypothetical protein
MINLHLDKKLSIILPNTNRALAEVLKSASPKELEVIAQGKDLKSILNSLLKESSQNITADKTLLELVKNNPTLKEIGNANQNIKELLNALKFEDSLQQIQKLLQKFLPNIKEINNIDIKSTLENSGVFLESKLKNIQNPQLRLKQLLSELTNILQKSELPNAKVLSVQAKEILSFAIIQEASSEVPAQHVKDNPKKLETLAKSVQNIFDKLTSELKNADPITNKDFATKLSKLEHLLEPKNLQTENFKLSTLQDSLKQVISTLQNSFTNESRSLLDDLNKIYKTLQSMEQNPTTQKTALQQIMDSKLPTDVKSIIDEIKSFIKNSDPMFSKLTQAVVNELSLLKSADKLSPEQNIKEILSNDLKAVLHKASDEISKLTVPNQSEILKNIDKLLLQIDYYQLASHLSNSSLLYVPFAWEQMEDGNITIKNSKDDKFYCDIELKLKEYGELKLRLTLYEKNQLNIHINSDNDEFKDIIKENIPTLRKALIDSQITPREIRFINMSKNGAVPYESDSKHLDIGFEVKA